MPVWLKMTMTMTPPNAGIKAMEVTSQGLEALITLFVNCTIFSLDYFLCYLVSRYDSRKSWHALQKHSVHVIPASSTWTAAFGHWSCLMGIKAAGYFF